MTHTLCMRHACAKSQLYMCLGLYIVPPDQLLPNALPLPVLVLVDAWVCGGRVAVLLIGG